MSETIVQRANDRRRSMHVAPFLSKLRSMVDDGSSDDLIRWSEDGLSFVVLRHEEFAKAILPRFFKHANFLSFVRQLNMYDFHKVPHLQQGGLISVPEAESWKFSNEYFQRGRPNLMHFIQRKKKTVPREIDGEALLQQQLPLPPTKRLRLDRGSSSARIIDDGTSSVLRRKVPSPPVITSTLSPSQSSHAAVSNAPVLIAGAMLSPSEMLSKFVEQVRQDIDTYGFSLEEFIRQLQSGTNQNSTPVLSPSAQLSPLDAVVATPPAAASTIDPSLQSLPTPEASIDELLALEELDNQAVSFAGPGVTIPSLGFDTAMLSEPNGTGVEHLFEFQGGVEAIVQGSVVGHTASYVDNGYNNYLLDTLYGDPATFSSAIGAFGHEDQDAASHFGLVAPMNTFTSDFALVAEFVQPTANYTSN
ncbi:Heat shock transcription factor [Coemansia sp. RSA 922]|nr:Heat shock transcription factor [Coemansia sp. RSA 922]KAJ2340118.1 Heat shock transcription factor [Coemansia sp. RSA 2673]